MLMLRLVVHKVLWCVAILIAIIVAPVYYNLQADDREERNARSKGWTKFYDMNTALDSEKTKPFKIAGDFKPKGVSKGILYFKTTRTETGYYYVEDSAFDNKNGTTAEIRLIVNSSPEETEHHDAAIFVVQDGNREGKISFLKGRIAVFDQNKLLMECPVSTHLYHTYRIDIFGDFIEVCVDKDLVVSGLLYNETKDRRIIFGDLAPASEKNLDAAVEYIAYSTSRLY